MSAAIYSRAVALFPLGEIDWEEDTFKVLLVTDRYVPDQVRDETRADLAGYELVPSGTYRSGGVSLDGRTVTVDGGEMRLNAAPVEVDGVSGAFRWAVVYRAGDTEDRGGDVLIAYTDLGLQEVTDARVSLSFDDSVCVFRTVKEMI